ENFHRLEVFSAVSRMLLGFSHVLDTLARRARPVPGPPHLDRPRSTARLRWRGPGPRPPALPRRAGRGRARRCGARTRPAVGYGRAARAAGRPRRRVPPGPRGPAGIPRAAHRRRGGSGGHLDPPHAPGARPPPELATAPGQALPGG